MHEHCPYDVCGGKAVVRSTEYHHWVATRELIESHRTEEHVETAMDSYFDEDPSSSVHAQMQPIESFLVSNICTPEENNVEESAGVVNEVHSITSKHVQAPEELGAVSTNCKIESSLAAHAGMYIIYMKQKHLRCKKVAWPRKTIATKRSDIRVCPRFLQ